MGKFPRIDSPCLYRANLSAILDGDHCRLCDRQVFDLTAMTDGERGAFLASCEGEVCVTYAIPVRPAIAAAALAAAALAFPGAALAQDAPSAPIEAAASVPVDADDAIVVTGGGIRDPKNARLVDNPLDEALPPLPVVIEDEPASVPTGSPAA